MSFLTAKGNVRYFRFAVNEKYRFLPRVMNGGLHTQNAGKPDLHEP